jgi:hypothetical protein
VALHIVTIPIKVRQRVEWDARVSTALGFCQNDVLWRIFIAKVQQWFKEMTQFFLGRGAKN